MSLAPLILTSLSNASHLNFLNTEWYAGKIYVIWNNMSVYVGRFVCIVSNQPVGVMWFPFGLVDGAYFAYIVQGRLL